MSGASTDGEFWSSRAATICFVGMVISGSLTSTFMVIGWYLPMAAAGMGTVASTLSLVGHQKKWSRSTRGS